MRIVLPGALQQRAIDIAHESHQGLSKIKVLLRTKTWFPCTDDLAKQTVDQYILCHATGKPNNSEPLRTTDMLSGPWHKVHLDFYGPLPSREYLLVCIDHYTINQCILGGETAERQGHERKREGRIL